MIEGMARVFADGYRAIHDASGLTYSEVVGAGNSIRKNQVLCDCIEAELGSRPLIPSSREEACTGAAMIAALGIGAIESIDAGGAWIHYGPP